MALAAALFALHQLRDLFRAPLPAQWKLGVRRAERRLTLTVVGRSII